MSPNDRNDRIKKMSNGCIIKGMYCQEITHVIHVKNILKLLSGPETLISMQYVDLLQTPLSADHVFLSGQ